MKSSRVMFVIGFAVIATVAACSTNEQGGEIDESKPHTHEPGNNPHAAAGGDQSGNGSSSNPHESMQQMSAMLEGKTGDDFDKAFIAMMIPHHQSAVDMAIMAESQAKHEELKKMAQEIISAQNKEIGTMRQWQNAWGYSDGHTDHNHDMPVDQSMTNMLKGKTGDEFDRMFISMMIPHHQGAVDMAGKAKINAKHPEIKTMANDIISSQMKEIATMNMWQKQWGY